MIEGLKDDKENDVNMYYGASPMLFELAKQLRGRMTVAEEILWDKIKINEWHLKFRRQHPIALYVADFYCHKLKLVIELDGGHHENREVKIYDEARERDIEQFGITVLRFKNEEVTFDIEGVLTKISSKIAAMESATKQTSSPNNSPSRDGGVSLLYVIKIGGNVIDDDATLQSFLKDFASVNGKKILVHGGGKIATKIGEQLGIQPNYVNGRRITDAATIDLVTMVYGGLVNKKVVAKLQSLQCNAIGLTGADANIIPATKRPVTKPSIENIANNTNPPNNSPLVDGGIDYGYVGDVDSDSLGLQNLEMLLSNNFTPVFAPLTHDGNGQMLNTNADTIASTLAVGLSEIYDVRLIYCFEKKGVLENVEDENSVIRLITKEKYEQLKQDKKLFDGILPKIDNAFAAIDNGVKEVLIGDAKDLLQNVTANTIGTLIK
ncbi:MAG: acetylglutamate kinase [Ferruginibacter sp.]